MARAAAIKEVRPVLEDIDKVADVVDKGLDAIEKGTDVGVEAVDKAVHVAVEDVRTATHMLRNPKIAAAVVLISGVAGAGYVGWQLAKRHYVKKYEADLEREIESARKFYGRLHKVDVTPEDLAKKHKQTAAEAMAQAEAEVAADALKEYQGNPEAKVVRPTRNYHEMANGKGLGVEATETEEVKSNIFVEGKELNPDEFDLVEEAKHRTDDAPYVISKDEFFENDGGNNQVSITYYAGDDVLADDRDQPIENVEATVGVDNLSRFGHGSEDKNIVYIRNPITDLDFEVAYSPGKYAEEVHGFIQHSDRPVGRFRLKADE